MKKEKQCDLCKLDKITYWHYESKFWVIIDCCICKTPMYVYRSHEEPSLRIVDEMLKDAEQRFPNRMIDMRRKKIPDHFHFHIRD